MTDQVDVAALRAIISRYRRAMIERDAASVCKRAGDMLDASHRAAEAARDMMNAAPALLDELDEWRDPLSARRQAIVEEIVMDVGDGQRSEVDLREAQLAQAEAQIAAMRAESKRLREALTGPVLSRIKNFQERDEHYAVDWAAVCSSIKSEVEAALAAQEQR